jgi:hypothetical protein
MSFNCSIDNGLVIVLPFLLRGFQDQVRFAYNAAIPVPEAAD